ncbi:MAG: hypothetical protein ACYTG5_14145 [Planctomycetota bacterium]|jgi:hypothetical protein
MMQVKSSLALAFLLCVAGSCRSPGTGSAEFPHRVPFELGEVEFYGGDGIVIEEVRGTAPVFLPGEEYVVRGSYELASQEEAVLMFSLTEMNSSGIRSVDERQHVTVSSGSGSFALQLEMPAQGYPHLTFYERAGPAVGGLYFGTGESVLAKKSWSYREP